MGRKQDRNSQKYTESRFVGSLSSETKYLYSIAFEKYSLTTCVLLLVSNDSPSKINVQRKRKHKKNTKTTV